MWVMTAELYGKVASEGGCVDLSARAKWRLAGADRVRYLNGQVTQDMRRVTAAEVLYACVTNVKGKIEGDLFVHAQPEALLLDAEPPLRETLGARLEKYIIADDAELTDVTEEWHLWHLFGPLPPGAWRMETEAAGGHVLDSSRFGCPGIDLWLPAGSPQARPLSALIHASHVLLSEADAETWRILRRLPRYPNELNADVFPPEAGLEERAMSFTKGCYIGQEILSRIKTTGKMPKTLVAWQAHAPETAVTVGDELFLPEEAGGGRAVGSVTSVTRHPQLGLAAGLAYVRQGAAAADSVLLVGSGMPRIGHSIRLFPPAST
jgi:tRNA-modifying protein YgfZ